LIDGPHHLFGISPPYNFEPTHNWYLGVNGGECVRVFLLTNPSRIVIDVQH